MIDFGPRLKEERERIGLSQAKFAEACGVGKTAQYTYERGDREPSFGYMEAAQKLGVDTLYVFTGTRTGKDWAYARAYSHLLYTVEMVMGLEEGRLEQLCKEYVALDEKMRVIEEGGIGGEVYYGDWQQGVVAWLGTSTKPDRCVDASLFACLLDAVEDSASKQGVSLPTEKRVMVALALYRDGKPQKEKRWLEMSYRGAIDQDVIDKSVKMAAA
jgi:transcriptional regulator with XRE-family HTH domain